jgi:hypothetical protein
MLREDHAQLHQTIPARAMAALASIGILSEDVYTHMRKAPFSCDG